MIISPQSAFENDNYEAEYKMMYTVITVKVKTVDPREGRTFRGHE